MKFIVLTLSLLSFMSIKMLSMDLPKKNFQETLSNKPNDSMNVLDKQKNELFEKALTLNEKSIGFLENTLTSILGCVSLLLIILSIVVSLMLNKHTRAYEKYLEVKPDLERKTKELEKKYSEFIEAEQNFKRMYNTLLNAINTKEKRTDLQKDLDLEFLPNNPTVKEESNPSKI